MTTDDLIRTPADLRPGDIMFGPITGAVGLGVALGQLLLGEGFRVGELSIRHVAIVTHAFNLEASQDLEMVEAMPRGARTWSSGMPGEWPSTRWNDHYAYVRLPEDYPGQAKDAAAIARLMVLEGVSYSFASYLALALWRWGLKTPRLERWINRRRPPVDFYSLQPVLAARGEPTEIQLPQEAICSVLVDQAWSLAGKRVMEGVARQCVTPGAMAGQLLNREGAVWAVPHIRSNGTMTAMSWEIKGQDIAPEQL